jgi:allophanate hydrolase subunit 1
MKDAKDILQWRQTFAFMLMRPGGNTVIGKKQYYWWKSWVTKPSRQVRFVTNTTTTEVKIKELR